MVRARKISMVVALSTEGVPLSMRFLSSEVGADKIASWLIVLIMFLNEVWTGNQWQFFAPWKTTFNIHFYHENRTSDGMEGGNNFPMECALAVNRKIINCLIKIGDGQF